jgi:catechol 2,3-dioxygenase-like lactoylglutathione lyase family enzyme
VKIAQQWFQLWMPTGLPLGRFAFFLRWLAVVLLLPTAVSKGQSVDLNGIAHAAFRVSDVANTSHFYQKLGFVQAFAFSKNGKISQAFIKINDRQFIELYPETAKQTEVGFMHLCFEGADLNQLNAAYRQRGLNPIPVLKAHAGNLLFTMVGPEHQNIEYTQYMPGSLHSNDRSKHLGKHRLSKHLLAVDLAMQDPSTAESFYIDKLSFHPMSRGNRGELLLPGTSGEAVEFKSMENKTDPDIVFQVGNLKRTAKALRFKGIAVRIEKNGLYVHDPDGIPIEFSTGPSLLP